MLQYTPSLQDIIINAGSAQLDDARLRIFNRPRRPVVGRQHLELMLMLRRGNPKSFQNAIPGTSTQPINVSGAP
eukprot:8428619-Pyramimonas_sp.AAC.1